MKQSPLANTPNPDTGFSHRRLAKDEVPERHADAVHTGWVNGADTWDYMDCRWRYDAEGRLDTFIRYWSLEGRSAGAWPWKEVWNRVMRVGRPKKHQRKRREQRAQS